MNSPYPGTCGDCCSCPSPTLMVSNISASKSKGGYIDPSGNPNSRFLVATRTLTYSSTCSYSNTSSGSTGGNTYTITESQTCTASANASATYSFNEATGVSTCTSCTGSLTLNSSGSAEQKNSDGTSSSDSETQSATATPSSCGSAPGGSAPGGSAPGGWITWTGSETTSTSNTNVDGTTSSGSSTSAVSSLLACGCEDGAPTTTTTSDTTAYTDEFTTADLEAAAGAALPSTWPAFSSSGLLTATLASAELASTDLSYSIEQGQYYWVHPVPPVAGYELTWVERFTPDGGGTPVDTARSYTWDGTVPSGYNPSDSTTWPKSTTRTVTQPSSNGSVTIANVKLICAGTTTQLVP